MSNEQTIKTLPIKFKKLNESAKVPGYSTDGAACFDLSVLGGGNIDAGASRIFNTGLSFEIPDGFVMLVFSRSGHGFKKNLRLSNCVGVIDSDYRGEVKVKVHNDSSNGVATIEPGERIAQAMVLPIPAVSLEESNQLNDTERAENGFGSTGES
jgi:dUTP pyrophosphatase